jgi:acyl-CoA thioester hydrolase
MVNDVPDRPASGRFADGEHRFPLRVYFEDTDLSGVVYHANYLRYMERARSDMLRGAGIDQRAAHEDGTGTYAIADLAIRYRAPARLDDDLLVVSRVTRTRAASCAIHQRVMRGAVVIAEAEVVAAFLSPDGRPKRQPAAWLEAFRRLQAPTSGPEDKGLVTE